MSSAPRPRPAFQASIAAALSVLVSTASALETLVRTKADLPKAQAALAAGDTLTLADGDWTDVEIRIAAAGTEDRPVLVRAQSPGRAVLRSASHVILDGKYITVSGLLFQGASTRSQDAVVFTANSSQCRLTQSAFDGYLRAGVRDDWVTIGGFRNRVDYCTFLGKKGIGIAVRLIRSGDKADEHVIARNYFGPRPVIDGNGAEEIQLGVKEGQFSDSKTSVEYNLFEDCNGELESISVKSGGNVIRGNTFLRCLSHLTLRHGSGSLVEGNFIDGRGVAGTGGIRVCGKNHKVVNNFATGLRATDEYGGGVILHSGDNTDPRKDLANRVPAGDCLVAFNTLVDNKQGITYGGGGTAPTGITLANNLIAGNAGTLVVLNASTPFAKLEGNILFGSSLGISQRAGIEVADPKLLKTDLNGYPWQEPGAGSPALGRASGNYALPGWTTPPPDIGENVFGPGALQPLARNQVGPAWKGGPTVSVSGKASGVRTGASLSGKGFLQGRDAAGRRVQPTAVPGPIRILFHSGG